MKNIFNNLNIRSLILLLSLCLSALSAQAQDEEGVHTRIHHHYQTPRALGMGDAFVAVANDYSAILYNPAGLARRENGQINGSLDFAFAPVFFEFVKDAAEAADDASQAATDGDRFNIFNAFLEKYYGKNFQFRTGLFEGFWARKNWGVAVIPMDLTFEYKVHNQVAPSVNIRTYADTTVAYGYARTIENWIPGNLQAGVTTKFVNRGYLNKQISGWDLVADSDIFAKEDFREGYTIDFDFGTLYTPEISADGWLKFLQPLKPTVGLVLRNALELGFGQKLNIFGKNNGAKPEKLYRVLDVGTKVDFPELWIFGGRFALDIRDIGHPSFNLRKGLHMGAEFDWTVKSWWKGSYRVGLNQGYFTGGLSALLGVFNLDLVTYGEDVGSYKTPKENRMYLAKFNFDW